MYKQIKRCTNSVSWNIAFWFYCHQIHLQQMQCIYLQHVHNMYIVQSCSKSTQYMNISVWTVWYFTFACGSFGFANQHAARLEHLYIHGCFTICVSSHAHTWTMQDNDTGKVIQLQHFHYTTWPDHGVPDNGSPLLAFHQQVIKHQAITGGPIVVHCRSFHNYLQDEPWNWHLILHTAHVIP